MGRGRRRRRHRLGPRRRADAELRPAAAADADRDQRSSRDRHELPRRRRRCSATRAELRGARRGGRAARVGLDGVAQRLREVRAQACAALDARALRFLDAIHFALPDDGVLVADMCIPGYWLAGLPHAAPRRGGCRSRSAGARSATRSPPRSAPRSPAPARWSRSPATAASCTRCGELATVAQEHDPADRGGGRRRRLRDAALRPGRARATARYGVDLRHARLRRARRELRRAGRDRRRARGRVRRGARRATSPTPSPSLLVARTPEPLIPPPNTSPNWYRRRR